MEHKSLDTFIFDFDGTIADSLHHVFMVYNQVASRFGTRTMLPDDISALRRMGAKKAIQEYNVPLWKVPAIAKAVLVGLRDQIRFQEPFAGVSELLLTLQQVDFRCFLLTSNSRENVEAFLLQHRIQVFEELVCSASLFGKSTRLRNLLSRARLSLKSTAYIGDQVLDVEAAKNAGVRSIAVSWGYNDRETLASASPDYLFDEPKQLLDFCQVR